MKSIKDEPNTQREYETIFILKPDTNSEQISSILERVRKIIEGMKGKSLQIENWGKRRLAYEIKKELKGVYLYWKYLGNQGLVEELERNLKMIDTVIRYVTIRLEENISPEERVSTVTEETYGKASTTVPDEEELALGASYPRFSREDDEDDEFNPELEELALRSIERQPKEE